MAEETGEQEVRNLADRTETKRARIVAGRTMYIAGSDGGGRQNGRKSIKNRRSQTCITGSKDGGRQSSVYV